MLYKTFSAAVYGIDANIIEVEVDVSGAKLNDVHFHTVGLPDAAVRESQDRVRSALRNCGYDIPPTHITVNLAPADIRKEGPGFEVCRRTLSGRWYPRHSRYSAHRDRSPREEVDAPDRA